MQWLVMLKCVREELDEHVEMHRHILSLTQADEFATYFTESQLLYPAEVDDNSTSLEADIAKLLSDQFAPYQTDFIGDSAMPDADDIRVDYYTTKTLQNLPIMKVQEKIKRVIS